MPRCIIFLWRVIELISLLVCCLFLSSAIELPYSNLDISLIGTKTYIVPAE